MAKHKPSSKSGKQEKAGKVMREFSKGTLRSGSGDKVRNPAQAKAIAMSESGQSRRGKPGKRGRR